MNDRISQYSVEPLAGVLLAVAAFLGALLFVQVVTYLLATADADSLVATATQAASGKPAVALSAEAKVAVEGLKKNNLFAPPAAKQYPISDVIGILGDQALINGQWYKAGDTVGEAKIIAIEPTKVKVTWNGQEKEFMPIISTGSGGSEAPGRKGGPPSPGKAGMVVTGAGPGGPGGMMAGLSPEERDQMRERLKTMAPEERQKFREEMRAKLGRRGQ
jgi:hypothetical protein